MGISMGCAASTAGSGVNPALSGTIAIGGGRDLVALIDEHRPGRGEGGDRRVPGGEDVDEGDRQAGQEGDDGDRHHAEQGREALTAPCRVGRAHPIHPVPRMLATMLGTTM